MMILSLANRLMTQGLVHGNLSSYNILLQSSETLTEDDDGRSFTAKVRLREQRPLGHMDFIFFLKRRFAPADTCEYAPVRCLIISMANDHSHFIHPHRSLTTACRRSKYSGPLSPCQTAVLRCTTR